ncbi:ubiquitin-conjugating enzyme E2 J1-like [Tribolium madens]|uniref:ubiquitin-conjugating enzyme E2 J1-like n=1 Tax=Tribolium madens TaxID=41895 RepID=UPI001CF75920|nr:ubiquitin-conjugating enzyme E2 J1-like [Tribolium madens]
MSLENKYNLKSPGVKRLMREARELAEPTEEYFAHPLEDNLFEWHFTVRGPPNTEFEGGFYHGRILLPSQYPMQPPNIILLTPNGRFEVNKKICLSISGHHPESWQPSWSIRTALLALIAFMPTPAAGTIGSLDYTPEERQILAKKSINWECQICGKIAETLSSQSKSSNITQEEASLIQQIALKAEEDANRKEKSSDETNIRQRVTINTQSAENINEPIADVIMETEVSINPSTVDQIFNVVVWVIVFVILLLIGRRFFLLE